MKAEFDQLAKNLAQSVTRRAALKKFGVGLAIAALASLGVANKAQAVSHPKKCGGRHGNCPRCYECRNGFCEFYCY